MDTRLHNDISNTLEEYSKIIRLLTEIKPLLTGNAMYLGVYEKPCKEIVKILDPRSEE